MWKINNWKEKTHSTLGFLYLNRYFRDPSRSLWPIRSDHPKQKNTVADAFSRMGSLCLRNWNHFKMSLSCMTQNLLNKPISLNQKRVLRRPCFSLFSWAFCFWGIWASASRFLSKRLHEEVHGMEDVELHGKCCDFLLCRLTQPAGTQDNIVFWSGQCITVSCTHSHYLLVMALCPTLAPAFATAWATTVSRPFRSTSKALLALAGQRGSTRRWKKPRKSYVYCFYCLNAQTSINLEHLLPTCVWSLLPAMEVWRLSSWVAFVGFFFAAKYAAVAPLMAPQLVCPSTKISWVFKAPVQNSKLPKILPSACVQVFPALRRTNRSPGRASKSVSSGQRESAQPTMAVWGAWPLVAKASRMLWCTLPAAGTPATKRSFPSFRVCRANLQRGINHRHKSWRSSWMIMNHNICCKIRPARVISRQTSMGSHGSKRIYLASIAPAELQQFKFEPFTPNPNAFHVTL